MLSDLPRPRASRRDAGRQRAVHAQDAFAALDQKPLQRARDMPAVLDRPHAFLAQAARPRAAVPRRPLAPDRTVCSPNNSPDVADTAAIVCERLWVSAPSTIMTFVHLHLDRVGHPADTACSGRCHAPIKSRPGIHDRRRATQRKAVRPRAADSLKESQLAAGRGAFTVRRTSPTRRIQTASLEALVPRLPQGSSGLAARPGARRAAVDVPKQQRPFRARAGAREQIEDLARCEPVCCPFLEYDVETTNDEVIFTVTNPSTGMERAGADVTLDAFDVLPTTRALATRACWSGSPTAAFTSARRARTGESCVSPRHP